MTEVRSSPVSMETVKEVVDDLRDANAAIYYLDLFFCSLIGWILFGMVTIGHLDVSLKVSAFIVSSLLLYRALAFIHELFHQQGMKGFRYVWHALAGVPLLIPFLLYLPIHQAHHNSKTYGTKDDGEYDQFLGHSKQMSLKLFLLNMGLPLAVVIRFGVLTPLSVAIPVIRREVIPNFVHMALRMPYRAPEIKQSLRLECYVVEVFCMFFAWALIALCFSAYWTVVVWWYALVILIATLNTIRALGSTHLYVEQLEGRGAAGQLLDSLNVDAGGIVTTLLCPTGLRFHALHHIAPYLPYHALPKAHQRLMARLPAESDYRYVTVPNVWQGWRRLVEANAR